jgi:hypothetical protein
VNLGDNVNIRPDNTSALERDLARVLAELLSSASWLKGWTIASPKTRKPGWDLLASGRLPDGRTAALCVECKNNHFQPSQFSALAKRSCSVENQISTTVLAMPRVSPRMAALCQEHGWSWYDLAGNCRLEIQDFLLIERSGNAPITTKPRVGANLGTPEAARVVRALLAPDNARRRWTQREMVAHFELTPQIPAPSLALVNKVVQYLREQAILQQLPNRGFRVCEFEGLLDLWRSAYKIDRHLRRPYFTLLQGRAVQDKLRLIDSDGRGRVAYASFSAADIQAPAVRQPRIWLYLNPSFEPDFQTTLEAKPVDSGENLVVLFPDDPGVFYHPELGSGRPPCTNAVQTYVDLASSRGRGEEAAEAILHRRLKPAWSAAR